MPKKEEQANDNFNPRSREGSDSAHKQPAVPQCKFQSTLPRRERRMLCDTHGNAESISIHAPAKGATVVWHPRC